MPKEMSTLGAQARILWAQMCGNVLSLCWQCTVELSAGLPYIFDAGCNNNTYLISPIYNPLPIITISYLFLFNLTCACLSLACLIWLYHYDAYLSPLYRPFCVRLSFDQFRKQLNTCLSAWGHWPGYRERLWLQVVLRKFLIAMTVLHI